MIINELIKLMEDINIKEIPENENPKNYAKMMLQKLPIALAQKKAGNTSENLLHGIRQIIYYLYREKNF